MSNCQILVRKIGNGFIVANGPPGLNRIHGSGPDETYFATEEELRAAAADLICGALASAEAETQRVREEMKARQAQSMRAQEAGYNNRDLADVGCIGGYGTIC